MTTNVQIRVDTKDKKLAEKNLSAIGLDLPTAFRAFIKKINMVGGMPFQLIKDSYLTYSDQEVKEILEASEEVKENMHKKKIFDNAGDFIKSLRLK